MTIFNLKTNKFEIYSNQQKFLTIQIDELRGDWKEIIFLFDKKKGERLALNNEDDTNLEICLELFSQENVAFACYLDFYRNYNIPALIELLKIYK